MRIVTWQCGFDREALKHPFGFKGSALTELWQIAVQLTDDQGNVGLGTGVQSVLWSDAGVFTRLHESGGNSTMLSLTNYALDQATKLEWDSPIDLQQQLLPVLTSYVDALCPDSPIRHTFILNALVPVDHAAWQLYAQAKACRGFDEMIPTAYVSGLTERHQRLVAVPLITYGTSLEDVRELAENGCSLFKIKVGADPDGNGDLDRMLEWDSKRIAELHHLLKSYRSDDTESGRIVYYLDANGRYDTLDRVQRLLDAADHVGALEDIALLEEPFSEQSTIEVGELPCCVVADESAHSVEDAKRRFAQGYSGLALKPVAKTLSASLQMLEEASKSDVQCFCADLTVPPYLLEWNRNVAARLKSLPSMKVGILESNGAQNYVNWDKLVGAHPLPSASWIHPERGVFTLSDSFYETSGGVFAQPDLYEAMATSRKLTR
ncbi:enolase C-terminal domain-like protein [Kiritimatiellota bacterium B12222]|nr:enolase C-terminal domain-like protein [Kiritimatiellota bacterium B12222]